MMNENDDQREDTSTDPLAKLMAELEKAPTQRCAHVSDQPGQLWWRDAREPQTVTCQPCTTRGRRSGYCCVCGHPQRGAYLADLGVSVINSHATQITALLCRVCVGLLPADVPTLTLSKSGAVRVNRPGGGPR